MGAGDTEMNQSSCLQEAPYREGSSTSKQTNRIQCGLQDDKEKTQNVMEGQSMQGMDGLREQDIDQACMLGQGNGLNKAM